MRTVSRLASRAFNLKTLAAALLAALLCAQAAAQQGQTAARPDRGVNPGGSYSVSDVESISLENGNVNLSIPLASLPPMAGGKLGFTLKAHYNSKLWNVVRQEAEAGFPAQRFVVDQPQLNDGGGWRISGRYLIEFREVQADFIYLPPPSPNGGPEQAEFDRLTQHNWWKVIVHTPDGSEHELRPTGSGFQTYGGIDYPRTYLWGFHTARPTAATGPFRYDTLDGTYISAVHNPPGHASGVRWTLFLPDGTQVIDYFNGVQRITDTNGNSIKIFDDSTGTHYQDEHRPEREIRVEYNPTGGNGHGQERVWYRTVGGVWQHIDVNYGGTVVQGKIYKVSDWNSAGQGFVCQRHHALPPQSLTVVREIVFPATEPNTDARRFSFSYNSDQTESATTQQFYSMCGQAPEPYTRTASRGMGALSRIVTPAGAEVDYTYTLASTHDFTGLLTPDRLTRETIATKKLAYRDLAGVLMTDEWTYNIPYDNIGTTSTVSNPDGSTSTIAYYQRHPDYPRGVGTGDLLAGQVFYTTDGLTATHRRWNMRGTAYATGTDNFVAANPYVEAEYTTLMENNAPVKMSAKTYERDHNGNVTKVTEYDWFDPNAVQREGGTGIPTGVPAGATVLRVTDTSYHNQAADVNSPSHYRNRALATGTPSLLGAVKETSVGASRTRFSYDGQSFGAAPTVGNITQTSRRDDKGDANAGNDTEVTTSTTYGSYGNPSTTTDANGNVTQLFYDDPTHALPTRVVLNPQNGTGTQTTTTVYDEWTGLVTSVADPNSQTTTIDYTNRLLNAVDPLGRPGMVRAPGGTAANGATLYGRTHTFYEDAARRVRKESDLKAEEDGLLKSRTTSDELGRVLLTERNEGGSSYTVTSRTVYVQAGRITLQSSPAHNAQPESWTRVTKDNFGRGVEAATFGGSAQPSATAAANTIANWTGSVTTSYAANTTTVTDQAGRKRRSVVDALGRLVRVDEPDKQTGALDSGPGNPVQPTSYAYDALGKLRRVEQGGQHRHFLYDSLGRLLRAKNPEQGSLATDADFAALPDSTFGNPNGEWSMGYLYDAGGNLKKRKDARGVVTTYGYDGLNRSTTVTYAVPGGGGAAATPNVTRAYDTGVRGKGRLALVAQGGSVTSATYLDEYDAAGRPLVQRQRFETVSANHYYTVRQGYDLAGNLKTQTYPSGRTVNYTYDDVGRLSGLAGNLGDDSVRTYANSFAYDAAGRVRQERYGTQTPLYHKRLYNSRGQLAEIRLGTATLPDTGWQRGAIINHYSASGWGATGGGSDNNGSLRAQDIFIPKIDGAGYDQGGGFEVFSQGFSYDHLNRLSRAAEFWGGSERWAQKFDYDRWGNRTIDHVNSYIIPQPQFTVDTATNRLGVPAGQSGQMGYDAAGNLTLDTYQGGQGGGGTRTFDAENRMTSAQFVAGQTQTASYVYDADGRRVKRLAGTANEVWQVYGANGELLAEYAPGAAPSSPRKEYGYRGGELLVTAVPGSGQQRVNVALASAGATATASTSYNSPPWVFPTSGAIDGEHRGTNWTSGGGWNDATPDVYPDWLQVSFNGAKTIDEIDVYTVQDAVTAGTEPTEAMTFSLYGLTAFDVQFWNGSAWVTVPGGSVTGNNKVWRKFTFAPVTTDKIRVVVNASLDSHSRVVEVEAWGLGADLRWLVSDQLGTPRMVVDWTGSLAGVTRHDYLPFGEQLFAGTGGRTPTLGYSASDNLRQKFTGYERDDETRLDYAQARYYTSVQGRFTSVDPLAESARVDNPQTFNRYSYVTNNPLNVIDPTGMCPDCDDDESEPVRTDSNQLHTSWLIRMGQRWYDWINGLLEEGWRPSQIKAFYGVDILAHPPTATAVSSGNETAQKVEPYIQMSPLGSYYNTLMAGRHANLGQGSQGDVLLNAALIPFEFTGVGGATRKQAAKTAVDALDTRLADVAKRHGGTVVQGAADTIRFPSRRVARQAASEMAGDLGSSPRAIRASDFRGGPHWMSSSNQVIGRESLDGTRMWRDDFLGHPRFNMGPHVNVSINGRGFHFFY